jgi:hypothetical protein
MTSITRAARKAETASTETPGPHRHRIAHSSDGARIIPPTAGDDFGRDPRDRRGREEAIDVVLEM